MQTLVPKMWEGRRTEELLEKVYSDLTGPEAVKIPYGKLYMLNFINDYSYKSWVYPLKQKGDAVDYFRDWKELIE